MAKCSVCGKSVLFGNAVSHSHRRSNKIFKPNVKKVCVKTASGNKRIYVCTSCLRSGKVERAVKEPAQSIESLVIDNPELSAVVAAAEADGSVVEIIEAVPAEEAAEAAVEAAAEAAPAVETAEKETAE